MIAGSTESPRAPKAFGARAEPAAAESSDRRAGAPREVRRAAPGYRPAASAAARSRARSPLSVLAML